MFELSLQPSWQLIVDTWHVADGRGAFFQDNISKLSNAGNCTKLTSGMTLLTEQCSVHCSGECQVGMCVTLRLAEARFTYLTAQHLTFPRVGAW